jgi:lysophospholipase L1-like esterase
MRHILFGDSIGFGVGDYENGGWATQLRLFIDRSQKNKAHNLINLSISGDTTRGLLNRMEREAKLRMRDKSPEEFRFLIAIGTNDSRVNKDDLENDISKEEFRENILKLIKIAEKLSKEIVLIGLVPVYEPQTTPFKENKHYIVSRMEEYNRVLREVAQERELKFVDMFADWKTKDLEILFADGLHPNTEGHKMIFETVKKALF